VIVSIAFTKSFQAALQANPMVSIPDTKLRAAIQAMERPYGRVRRFGKGAHVAQAHVARFSYPFGVICGQTQMKGMRTLMSSGLSLSNIPQANVRSCDERRSGCPGGSVLLSPVSPPRRALGKNPLRRDQDPLVHVGVVEYYYHPKGTSLVPPGEGGRESVGAGSPGPPFLLPTLLPTTLLSWPCT
jgi:hypothetical protein